MTNINLFQIKIKTSKEFDEIMLCNSDIPICEKYNISNFNNTCSTNYSLLIGETVRFLKEHFCYVEKQDWNQKLVIEIEEDNNKINFNLVKYYGEVDKEVFITCFIDLLSSNII